VTSGGTALAQRVRVPRPGERAGFIMIKKIQPVVEKKIQPEVASFKRQASSFKQRLTAGIGCYRMYLERIYMDTEQLKRIADAIEEILQLVKADQERSRKYMEESKSE